MSLSTKTILVTLNISQWTARKYDRKATQEVDDAHGTAGAGRYNKLLIAEEAIKKVAKEATAARTFFYTNTLPWDDIGARLLPCSNYLVFTQTMSQHQRRFENAVQEFTNNYPALIAQRQAELKTLFNPDDYPAASLIGDRFRFAIGFTNVPDAGDLRVEISQDEIKIIQQQLEQRTQTAQASAMRDLYDRLFQAVNHAAETLGQPDKIFRDSLIGNLEELTDLLPRLNFTGDAALDDLTQQVRLRLANLTPDRLRTNPAERKDAARDAKAILDAMSGIYSPTGA